MYYMKYAVFMHLVGYSQIYNNLYKNYSNAQTKLDTKTKLGRHKNQRKSTNLIRSFNFFYNRFKFWENFKFYILINFLGEKVIKIIFSPFNIISIFEKVINSRNMAYIAEGVKTYLWGGKHIYQLIYSAAFNIFGCSSIYLGILLICCQKFLQN